MRKLSRLERKKKKRKRFFLSIIFIIFISFITAFSLKSTVFNIDDFEIKGNKKLIAEEIIKTSMLDKGDNIFKIDKKNSISNIEEMPYIKSVKLSRKLPNKVEINIVERKAVLYIQKASVFLLMDEEGFLLEEKEENEDQKPILIGLNMENVDLGDNVFSIEQSNGIIEFIQETINLKLLNIFDRVDLKTKENITIQLKDGIVVAFGDQNNVKYKLRLLDEVLKDTRNKNIKFTKIIMNKGANPILVTED